MGFLDKFLKKMSVGLATRYAVVRSGKYEGCYIALGNPTDKKVEIANCYSQMVILNLEEKEEVARLDIEKDIEVIEYLETITFPATGAEGYRCKIVFTDGEYCDADVYSDRLLITFCFNLDYKMLNETKEFLNNAIEKMTQMI